MKNNIGLSLGETPTLFTSRIIENLTHNLSESTCKSVASLLAIDYVNRLNSSPDLLEYIETCISRLKKHLGLRIILDSDFTSSMHLFTIAITPEKDIEDNNKNQTLEASIESTIEHIISSFFSDITPMEQAMVKSILEELLSGKDTKEITNFITSNPKLFYSFVVQSMNTQKHQEEITLSVKHNLENIINHSKQLERKVENIKDISGKAILATSMLLVSSISVVVSPALLPLFLVPSIITSVKYAPKLGNKLGDIISQGSDSIKQDTKILNKLLSKNIVVGKTKEKVRSVNTADLQNIDLDGLNLNPPKKEEEKKKNIETKYKTKKEASKHRQL
ncbi:RP853 family protein [Rickettsiaceae bacterium]|nr:RP853 family protein [Rickettsiaceae bacterium]